MAIERMKVAAPSGPHAASIADPQLLIQAYCAGSPEKLLMIYDPRNRCGGLYQTTVGLWTLSMPIALGDYLRLCAERGIRTIEGEDQQRWLDRIEAVFLEVRAGARH